jgi:hypothetical protein
MSQIVDGIGTSPDRPLTGLGIRGFNDMIYTFHLETVRQEIVGSTELAFLDQMTCSHIVMNDVIELYNLVPKPDCLLANPTSRIRGGKCRFWAGGMRPSL